MNTAHTKNRSARLVAATAAIALGALGLTATAFARTGSTPVQRDFVVTMEAEDRSATVAGDRTELPREWRWERPAKNFDSMYR